MGLDYWDDVQSRLGRLIARPGQEPVELERLTPEQLAAANVLKAQIVSRARTLSVYMPDQ